jgi:exopolyphosphatase/guanosine-5'-triphosphate,3'-diphosphate pyrophosphatase
VTVPRLATIDLGTNTVRLLVVDPRPDGRWDVITEAQRVTRLGEGLAAVGRLGGGPMTRTAAVVAEYVRLAEDAGAAEVRIVATSAVRDAANGSDFVAAVTATTGRPVEVVSGQDEARLTIAGILRGLGAVPPVVLAFDIGGGSTEFVLARDGGVVAATSLRLGVVPLAERFPFAGAVETARYDRMQDEVAGRLRRELPPAIRNAGVEDLIGTAGTVTTLGALDLELAAYDAGRVQGHRLPRAAVDRLLARLGALTVDERAALPCLEPGRADLILAGVAIVRAALDVTGAAAVVVSDWGLREGIIADLIDRLAPRGTPAWPAPAQPPAER